MKMFIYVMYMEASRLPFPLPDKWEKTRGNIKIRYTFENGICCNKSQGASPWATLTHIYCNLSTQSNIGAYRALCLNEQHWYRKMVIHRKYIVIRTHFQWFCALYAFVSFPFRIELVMLKRTNKKYNKHSKYKRIKITPHRD